MGIFEQQNNYLTKELLLLVADQPYKNVSKKT